MVAATADIPAPPRAPALTSAQKTRWQALVAPYRGGDVRKSLWQLSSTLVGLVATAGVSAAVAERLPWLSLLLAPVAAGFLVRVFIIQHDCGHGSFFPSQVWNDRVGMLCGVLMMTPYYEWRRSHAVHHAGAGNLERRGTGDIYTMTLQEYRSLGFWRRLQYRLFRNPLVLFGVGPLFVFLLVHRVPGGLCHDKGPFKERLNVHLTTLASLAMLSFGLWSLGTQAFLLAMALPAYLACAGGVWLFYVQHQYDEPYWSHEGEWSYENAGIFGSSFYKLPKVLQYFSGNIGYHHIHHLAPKVPNYALERCHDENAWFRQATTLTFFESLQTLRLKLYDEASGRMVGFDAVREGGHTSLRHASP